jgi:hypothetical protein
MITNKTYGFTYTQYLPRNWGNFIKANYSIIVPKRIKDTVITKIKKNEMPSKFIMSGA